MTKLLEIQKEIGSIKKDKENPFFSSSYFDINGLLDAVKPVLNKHGVVLLQPLTNIDGKLALETRLVDAVSGETIVSSVCPIQGGDNAQKDGSGITYYRRYALQSLLGLEAEDDDGNSATPVQKAVKKVTEKKNYTVIPKGEREDVGKCSQCDGKIQMVVKGVSAKGPWEKYACTKDKEHSGFSNQLNDLLDANDPGF